MALSRAWFTTRAFAAASYFPACFVAARDYKNLRDLRRYAKNPVPEDPPSAIKRLLVLELFVRSGCDTFVETGTYYGDTTRLIAPHARRVFTIEISPVHYRIAKRTLPPDKVDIALADSAAVLGRLLPSLKSRTLFFLDAHPTNEATTIDDAVQSPVLKELATVAGSPTTTAVVIDDAISFGRDEGYPSREAIMAFAETNGFRFAVSHNMFFMERSSPVPAGASQKAFTK
jgi:predicted O-methyltransferase YrrM